MLFRSGGENNVDFVPAAELATGLMGDSIATNMFMLGYAYQKGWVPLSGSAIVRAIQLNGIAVEFNVASFTWGRRAAVDLERVRRAAVPAEVIPIGEHFSRSLEELVERRVRLLTDYQDAAWAARYSAFVDKVRIAESDKLGSTKLAEAVARYYAKLMAYKDEYEVARLYANGDFARRVAGMFEGGYKTYFYLAPPLIAKPDPRTGEPRKMRFGPWVMTVFRLLARMKGLRGGALDVFGRSEERRTERALIGEYEKTIDALLAGLSAQNHGLAVQIASLPEEIRGYGHIKLASIDAARARTDQLLARFRAGGAEERAAA